MPAFQLTRRAREDLRSIGRHTQAAWGREQRSRYLGRLDAAFRALAEFPEMGQACDDIREGYRKYHVGRHLIFYRQSSVGITVIRILHDRMDIEIHLSESDG
ncbi:type II toxin-antitoxin system RelE/ParE family toxin [Candidatus Entotheonella palauensis]|uniref:type II toxin-antitoxin system RelE/ParE family toxin n=1 Tax=Candidatus Entotheonella palauensis TaxID=93172 RepID=UPI000B7C6D8B|nr:type II toxin-antitoxin system RelE/ParE family toxin [Candidatus Entotheonella palauensis]